MVSPFPRQIRPRLIRETLAHGRALPRQYDAGSMTQAEFGPEKGALILTGPALLRGAPNRRWRRDELAVDLQRDCLPD